MKTSFAEEVQRDIVHCLESGAMDLPTMSRRLNRPYHTVRKHALILQDEGHIRPLFNGTYRNVKYTLGASGDPNNSIPQSTTLAGKKFKIHVLANNTEESFKTQIHAVTNMARHMTRLMLSAVRAYEGEDVTPSLNALKIDMEKDIKILQNLLEIYKDIYSNPRNWDSELIKRYPLDASFNAELLAIAKSRHYPEV